MSISVDDACEVIKRLSEQGDYIFIDRAIQAVADQTEHPELFAAEIQQAVAARRQRELRSPESLCIR